MNWARLPIILKHQDTGPFGIVRVILNNHGPLHAFNNVTGVYVVLGQFIVPVLRHLHLAPGDQTLHKVQGLTHGTNLALPT